ncbi:MAG: AGE family epimerase/isomerase [Chloroflexi bacterium]|nr:AGE family epimerase/isomerase [Chloroflexota bacterium]
MVDSKRFLSIFVLLGATLLRMTSAVATEPGSYDTYDQTLFLDTGWYRESLITSADLWNGGLDGQSGMGAYKDNFNGFFHSALDRQWRQKPQNTTTGIAQSRAIYMNVEAYRAAGPEDGARFLEAANQGVDFLLTEFRDPEHGGIFWEVSRRGATAESMKQGYGNVHPIFALAQAYGVTGNPAHLDAALEQLTVFEERFLDPAYDCAIHPGFSRDFSRIIGVNNIDVFTHFFEALLALHDVTEDETRDHIDALLVRCGDFLVNTLYQDQEGFTDRGYVAYNYDENWQPAQMPYSRDMQWSGAQHATTGHNIELAYLLSRAVERGFDPEWLDTADKLLRFCLEYAIDAETGGMIYEITDYDGQPLDGNPDNALYVWWAQAETARALLHFTVARGHDEYAEDFKKVEALFHGLLTDQEYGGLYQNLDAATLQPVGLDKANIWKVNYHYAMFFAEALRLGMQYSERLEPGMAGTFWSGLILVFKPETLLRWHRELIRKVDVFERTESLRSPRNRSAAGSAHSAHGAQNR